MRANAPARSEQTKSPKQRFPFFTQSGIDAAALWLQAAPLSMADFRDLRYRNLIAGLGYLDSEQARHDAFNDGFAHRLALAIAGVTQ